ncbi:hypothetical protein OP500_00995 [Kingella sp. SNUBH-2017]|uniref:hypothetical protein n=1 Tax=Kingella sp. SNUBH-2017 TaxID=2994077 RepID=UPI0023647314|nr:hypothetical protein [Kingella sp. SNUBH-2017]MDD2181905.1 hypothetical protein [Kingella sp. SNUBH-2017]
MKKTNVVIICRNQQRCLHFSDFGCRPNWQVLPLVKNAARHGEAAWFLISGKTCQIIMQPKNESRAA